ncbi:MAG TPA: ribonuclease HI family protein, partial [Bacteroidetes bacterium]|nr:ribonuclease HI family protein [Bacteroidota bacterium]
MGLKLTAVIDGASRGNPGDSAIGVLVRDEDGREVLRISRTIGSTTNNVAEYTALITCLESLKDYKIEELTIKTDSQLMARQLMGFYKVRDFKLKALFQKVRELIQEAKFPVH